MVITIIIRVLKKKTQAVQAFSVLTTSSDRRCWDLNENVKGGNKWGGKVEDVGLY